MTKKVIDTFNGELFMSDADAVEESVKSCCKPDDGYLELKKVILIYDQENNCRYLVGDFIGDDECYPFTIKIFLYNDGKALGNLKYVAEAKFPVEKVDAKFVPFNVTGFIIYGFFFS